MKRTIMEMPDELKPKPERSHTRGRAPIFGEPMGTKVLVTLPVSLAEALKAEARRRGSKTSTLAREFIAAGLRVDLEQTA